MEACQYKKSLPYKTYLDFKDISDIDDETQRSFNYALVQDQRLSIGFTTIQVNLSNYYPLQADQNEK